MSEQRPVLTLKRKTSDGVVTKTTSMPEQKIEQPVANIESKQETTAPKKQAKQKKPKEIMPLEEAIAQLQAVWPVLFDNGQPRLLKIGIFAELCTDSQKNEYGVSNKKIRRCLESITRSWLGN